MGIRIQHWGSRLAFSTSVVQAAHHHPLALVCRIAAVHHQGGVYCQS